MEKKQKLLLDIFEERNDWIGPVNDLVLNEIVSDHKTQPLVHKPISKQPQHQMKSVDQESAEWIVSQELVRNEAVELPTLYADEQEQVMEQITRFDSSSDNTLDILISTSEKVPKSPMKTPTLSKHQGYFIPSYEDKQTRLFLESCQGFDSNTDFISLEYSPSQMEDSVQRIWQVKDKEPRDQFIPFLKSLAKELGNREKSTGSQLRNFMTLVGERYDRITGTKLGSRFIQSIFAKKIRKFVAPNEQSVTLNDQERKLLKQVASLFNNSLGESNELNGLIPKPFAKL